MIEEFPAEHEWIGFFESEPEICDPGVPWIYNSLRFTTVRDDIKVQVNISPSYGDLSVSLQVGEQELTLLELRGARSVRIVSERGREMLIAGFASPEVGDFTLQLKPSVQVLWGNVGR